MRLWGTSPLVPTGVSGWNRSLDHGLAHQKLRSQHNQRVWGCEVQSLAPGSTTKLGSRPGEPWSKYNPAERMSLPESRPPRVEGSAKREDQTHRVHQSAMVQGLTPSGGPENGEGSSEVTSRKHWGYLPECNANDRTPPGNQPTWKDHQRGVLGFSPPLLPCSNRTPRASRD